MSSLRATKNEQSENSIQVGIEISILILIIEKQEYCLVVETIIINFAYK